MALTHLPMDGLLPGEPVRPPDNNEPLRDTPHINVCVDHTDYRPLPIESLLALGKRPLTGRAQRATTIGEPGGRGI